MIIASLSDSARYESLNPLFQRAFDFVREAGPSSLEPGPHVLEEDALIVMVNEPAMKKMCIRDSPGVFHLFGRFLVHTESGYRKGQRRERHKSGDVPPQSRWSGCGCPPCRTCWAG